MKILCWLGIHKWVYYKGDVCLGSFGCTVCKRCNKLKGGSTWEI